MASPFEGEPIVLSRVGWGWMQGAERDGDDGVDRFREIHCADGRETVRVIVEGGAGEIASMTVFTTPGHFGEIVTPNDLPPAA